ncbi:hypothetical protein [uncultured Sphingorhabdus sp.]|uniref:hypothetical protein n=1 Tax=uncultured Sphingorhabdus sp. TaxID=1686106 RepID=UPI002612FF99|nr:hypothetical protein [uncultured Sphingorhabdus sp.]HMS19592.1 hypothetical protein [Sphingorhabdus sp.]
MRGVLVGVAIVATIFASVSAQAETLAVEVRRPAAADEAYLLRSLAVERFTGTDGRAFAFSVERALGDAREAGGQPVFEMFEAGRGEGAVTGRADVDIEESRYMEKRKFCPNTRDKNAKCEDAAKEVVEITCRKRIASLDADLRIARASDGRIVFSHRVPNRAEHRFCTGDAQMPEISNVVRDMITSAARSVVGDFVPYSAVEQIRIREDRKGFSKSDAELFKLAVKTTKTSGQEACRQFGEISQRAPDQRSLVFNMALCAEAAGDFEVAITGFRRLGNDIDALASIQRVEGTLAGLAQKAAREGADS